jgi:hypothetical protein
VDLKGKPLTYRAWIEGIRDGRTVVSRNGHNEFLEMTVNGRYAPGDEIKARGRVKIPVRVKWTATDALSGRIELVSNGKILSSTEGNVTPDKPFTMDSEIDITKSSWICARRMDESGHQTHTAPVYVTMDNKPIRASADDARYFISWIDNLLAKTSPGAEWNRYFPNDIATVQARYRKAREIYSTILSETEISK